MNFSAAYAKYRGSWAFPGTIGVAVIGWMGLSISATHGLITGHSFFDTPGVWGNLNIALSIEASLATTMLLMDTARSATIALQQFMQLKAQLDILEEHGATIERQSITLQKQSELLLALVEELRPMLKGNANEISESPILSLGANMASEDNALRS